MTDTDLILSIDNGGTFTDAVLTDGADLHALKVLTTPHDLTVAFRQILSQAAETLSTEETALLKRMSCIRYSTTLGTNTIIQRNGPRLGLLTDLADRGAFSGLVSGILPEDDELVTTLAPNADPDTIIKAAETIVERGAERLVIALGGEDAKAREKAVRTVLLREYPRHILGAVPMLFSTDVTTDGDAVRRLQTAVLNAYLHPSLEHFLYNAEDILRDRRFVRPLFIFCNDDGTNRVARVTAIKTYNSGPTGGVAAARYLAERYDADALVALDVGGTSSDISFVIGGDADTEAHGHVEDAEISIPLRAIEALGAGGGTIARVVDGVFRFGPDSAGAAPGPACFGFGGELATVTDANVALGILPDGASLAGCVTLDAARAQRAIETNIGKPLGQSVEAAAALVRDTMEGQIGGAIAAGLNARGKSTDDAVLVAFGGAGPMHACGIAEHAGVKHVFVPRLASVFSAFGIGHSDVQHTYDVMINGDASDKISSLEEKALREVRSEGFDSETAQLSWALGDGGSSFDGRAADVSAGLLKAHGSGTEALSLTARVDLPKTHLSAVAKSSGKPASLGTRSVAWDGANAVETTIYAGDALNHGVGPVAGPVIVQADDTTVCVPPGWTLTVDENNQYRIAKEG
ncbi:MAG: hydantoinase/oxoprolinase family protein [Pseudomonadota bacterium]